MGAAERSRYLEGGEFQQLFFREVINEGDWYVGVWEGEGGHLCRGEKIQGGNEMACKTVTAPEHMDDDILEGLEPCDRSGVESAE